MTSGALGQVERVDVSLTIPAPPGGDPRWSLELAGGATMDLGCYVLHAARQVSRWLGVDEPTVSDVTTRLRAPSVDAAMTAHLRYPGGVLGTVEWDMDATGRSMVWTVTGSAGSATAPSFGVPHLDNRLLVTQNGQTVTEVLGDQTSYTYQLAAVAATLRDGTPFLLPDEDAVANAELIDARYRATGLPLRGGG